MNDEEKLKAQVAIENITTLAKIDNIVRKKYLKDLSLLPIVEPPESFENKSAGENACLFPINKLVYDREENNLQKMTNVYVGAAAAGASIVLILHHPVEGKAVKIYMGVCDEKNFDSAYSKAQIFFNNLTGNFPGCQTREDNSFLNPNEITALMNTCLDEEKYHAISCVSGIASLREKESPNNATFFQGIEKLIEGMEDRSYSAIIIANLISDQDVAEMQAEYENLYHMLSPLSKISLSLSQSDSESLSKTISHSFSKTISETKSTTLSVGHSNSIGSTYSKYKGSSDSLGINLGLNASASYESDYIPIIGKFKGDIGGSIGAGYSHSWFRGQNWGSSTTVGETDTTANTKGETQSETTNDAETKGKTISVTQSLSRQVTYENKIVQVLMSIIDQKIKRLNAGSSQGMFAVSAYFSAPELQSVNSAASIYKAIITGDKSQIESSVINSWRGNEKYKSLKKYLANLCHPLFQLYKKEDQVTVTPVSIVTASELAIHMGLPKKSVTGIPVSFSVSFARNVHNLSPVKREEDFPKKKLPLGNVYHLGKIGKTEIDLDWESLSMHTLLCGTTGVGKSNISYLLLNYIYEHMSLDAHFLVIEPAKGEYKNVFKGNVSVYGTNPYLSQMLRINPFRFFQREDGKGVHILEHLDRLTAIFNVCWPMEAAMPAVLKRALERAYVAAGWDLKRSKNSLSLPIFPTFEDVMNEVENLMFDSEYSEENKGDYIGALCTRLRDLTDGINGMIFGQDDLPDTELFDQNVIVDLSRVGSSETKALIMGLLLIRLQEYRQSETSRANDKMKHLTVIEEAHHLLKRTSSEQSTDSANLMGRSVEMIANAFAEMRTYGEGFLIVDQSPEQLDKAVIRNTNTKIIMRLPEYEDRNLVGKAIGLTEEQITELAKLPTGVAAVYQNDWLESVLVKAPKVHSSDKKDNEKILNEKREDNLKQALLSTSIENFEYWLKNLLSKNPRSSLSDENSKDIFNNEREDHLRQVLLSVSIEDFERWLKSWGENLTSIVVLLQISGRLKRAILKYSTKINQASNEDDRFESFAYITYEFFHAENAFRRVISKSQKNPNVSLDVLQRNVIKNLKPLPKVNVTDNMFQAWVIKYQLSNEYRFTVKTLQQLDL